MAGKKHLFYKPGDLSSAPENTVERENCPKLSSDLPKHTINYFKHHSKIHDFAQ